MSTANKNRQAASPVTAVQNEVVHMEEGAATTFDGKVVSISGSMLVMTNNEGKECSHTLATDAAISCDGAVCKVEDLKVGSTIRVTTRPDDRNVATGIESLDKNAEFTECCP